MRLNGPGRYKMEKPKFWQQMKHAKLIVTDLRFKRENLEMKLWVLCRGELNFCVRGTLPRGCILTTD